jgi:hypothetical protein
MTTTPAPAPAKGPPSTLELAIHEHADELLDHARRYGEDALLEVIHLLASLG